ncbi:DUF4157 domain-containing protein [Deinococcus soli (ex Cha et al. 2016)]|nr:DUF4157 domain-containing protein [Deinococcus soli (ex Cha et al. 2016)]MDR6330963.1 hypothetical protein [Deinococcus soli (ex Cha et al. 2016)]
MAQSLQRQLAELDAEATQPVLARIQARRGGGNPLPDAIRRHLERGLNYDLSRVRIHDDAEADKLAKGVNAIAFTTGADIFFQSGKFNPNTQSGLELLAHEVTHTVQQSQGRVGSGIDPDAGLEREAQVSGARLASTFTPTSFLKSSRRPVLAVPRRLAPLTPVHAAQRLAAGHTVQRSLWGDWWKTFQNKALEAALEVAARVPNGPTIVAAFKRSQAVFGKIMANPGGFFKNLTGAAVNGFALFRTNIAGHLHNALIDWLTGTAVAATGGAVMFPKSLDGKALLGFGMDILGLNTATLVARLGRRYGAQNVQKVQGQLAILQQARGGLHQLNEFRHLDGKARDGMLSAARSYAIQTVVQQAVTWVSSFIVTGGLGPVARAAFALISTFLNNAQTFGRIAGGVLDSLQDIAGGQVMGAARKVEQNLGRVTGLVLKFVSKLLGLDKVGAALRKGLAAVQKPINTAIDKVVGSKPVQTVFQKLKAAGGTVAAQARGGLKNLWTVLSGSNRMMTSRLPVKGTKHHLWVEIRDRAPVVIMASNPLPLREQLLQMEKEASAFLTGAEKAAVDQAQVDANQLVDAGVQDMLTYIQTRPRGANPAADEAWLRGNTTVIRGKLANMGKDTITKVNARVAPAVAILDRYILNDQDLAGVITSAGGIVAFLQQIAAGRTVGSINKAQLAALWDRRTGGQVRHRETLIRLFRAALSEHHEWIPSDLMLDVVERDFDLHQFGRARFWIDLQHQTRTKTQYLVFKKVEMEGGQAVIQGHAGSVYRKETTLQGTARYLPAVMGQAGFHNALRGAFKGGSDRQAVMQGLASTVQQYIWDGSPGVFPRKIHPDSFWRRGQGQYVSFQNSFPTIQQAIQVEYAAILQLLRS